MEVEFIYVNLNDHTLRKLMKNETKKKRFMPLGDV